MSVGDQIRNKVKVPSNLADLAREFYELADEVDDRIALAERLLEGSVS